VLGTERVHESRYRKRIIVLVVITIQKLIAYMTLVRPKHWLKNVLVFVPILYARNLTNLDLLRDAILCFASFCLLSSAIYAVNDIVDVENDRKHPTKNKRPIASGKISVGEAIVIAIFLCVVGSLLLLIGYNNYRVVLYAVLFALLNIAYSFFLKHIVIIDCFCIAAGFVLRIFAGAAASNSDVSEWLFLTMTAVSLFMAFGKRRVEIVLVDENALTRKALASYNLHFLDGIIFVCAGLSVVFYALWSMASISTMIYTVPLVIFIVCKYLLIVQSETYREDPISIIFGDKGLFLAACIFGLLSVVLLYI